MLAFIALPDSRILLATTRAADSAPIWDLSTGRAVGAVTTASAALYAPSWGFGPDGRLLLAAADTEDSVRVWDPDTGQTLHTLTGHTGGVNSVAWGNGPTDSCSWPPEATTVPRGSGTPIPARPCTP